MLLSVKRYSFFLLFPALALASGFVLSENSPVKSIDESGHITYSDKPVENAKDISKIDIKPGPSQAEIKTAQQQANKNINTAKQIELPHEVEKKNKPIIKTPKKELNNQQNTTNSTTNNRWPYGAIPRPKPPVARPPGRRPGINPPPPSRPVNAARHR